MKILLADDHVLFREAITSFIHNLRPQWEVETASDLYETIDILKADRQFDLLLMDLRMPGMHGTEGIARLLAHYPTQKVGILSGLAEDHHIKSAIAKGAQGYFPKTLSGKHLIEAIDYVMSGKKFVPMDSSGYKIFPSYYDERNYFHANARSVQKQCPAPQSHIFNCLTPREKDVVSLIAQGHSNQDIAQFLGLQLSTIKLHVSAISRKLELNNRTQIAITAYKTGFYQDAEGL